MLSPLHPAEVAHAEVEEAVAGLPELDETSSFNQARNKIVEGVESSVSHADVALKQKMKYGSNRHIRSVTS